jgi:hypothetical protein
MESSIAVFLLWRPACELLPTYPCIFQWKTRNIRKCTEVRRSQAASAQAQGAALRNPKALNGLSLTSRCVAVKLGQGIPSQRSLHYAPIFRLLLKVAVKGTHQCDLSNFCGVFWTPTFSSRGQGLGTPIWDKMSQRPFPHAGCRWKALRSGFWYPCGRGNSAISDA